MHRPVPFLIHSHRAAVVNVMKLHPSANTADQEDEVSELWGHWQDPVQSQPLVLPASMLPRSLIRIQISKNSGMMDLVDMTRDLLEIQSGVPESSKIRTACSTVLAAEAKDRVKTSQAQAITARKTTPSSGMCITTLLCMALPSIA